MKKNNIILAYHSVETPPHEVGAEIYCVSLENFRKQMGYLVGSRELGVGRVEVTFDDGDVTNYTKAYPVLKELGIKAYFFIIVGRVGTAGYMDWDEINKIKNDGMIIGSHGMSHSILTNLDDTNLEYELVESKRKLERYTGSQIDYFSIPRGFCNKVIIKKARKTGYKAVFTSSPGDNDGFKIGRISVKADWDLVRFTRILNNGFSFMESAREIIKDSSKKILGAAYYDKIRTRILK